MGKASTLALLDADPQLIDVVLGRMTTEPIKPSEACQAMGLSWGALVSWCNDPDYPKRMEKFKNALSIRAFVLSEEALEVADAVSDKDDVPAATLQVNTRKWIASRLNPKWFGDAPEKGLNVGVRVEIVRFADPEGTPALEHSSVTVLANNEKNDGRPAPE